MCTHRQLATSIVIAAAVLAGCSTPRVSNAPPAVVEDCEREVALLTNEQLLAGDSKPLEDIAPEPASEEAIEDARLARAEAQASDITAWPAEALMYRCLASRGIALEDEQARVLADWERRHENAEVSE